MELSYSLPLDRGLVYVAVCFGYGAGTENIYFEQRLLSCEMWRRVLILLFVVYLALRCSTPQSTQRWKMERYWTCSWEGCGQKMSWSGLIRCPTLRGGTFKYHEENCYDRNVQKYYWLGQLCRQERLVREAGKKELKKVVPLYQTTKRHIPQYDVRCRKKDRNCIWNYGWKPAKKSGPCSCIKECFVLYMRNQQCAFINIF